MVFSAFFSNNIKWMRVPLSVGQFSPLGTPQRPNDDVRRTPPRCSSRGAIPHTSRRLPVGTRAMRVGKDARRIRQNPEQRNINGSTFCVKTQHRFGSQNEGLLSRAGIAGGGMQPRCVVCCTRGRGSRAGTRAPPLVRADMCRVWFRRRDSLPLPPERRGEKRIWARKIYKTQRP
jgi:hypothetical protein